MIINNYNLNDFLECTRVVSNVNEKWNDLKKHAAVKKKRVGRKKSPWITPHL